MFQALLAHYMSLDQCCTSLRCGINWDMFIPPSWSPDRPLRMREMKCHSGVWIYTMTWASTCKGESFISAPKTTPNYLNYSSLGSHSGSTFEMQQPVHAISADWADFVKTSLGHTDMQLCLSHHDLPCKWLWFPMQVLRSFPQVAGTTSAVPRLWVWSSWRMDIFFFWCWRLPGQKTLCAWPVFFLSQSLLETEQWAPQSFVTPWNVILVWLSHCAAGSTPTMARVRSSSSSQAGKCHSS